MRLTTTARVEIPAAVATVFDVVTDNATLPRVFHGRGRIPAIKSSRVSALHDAERETELQLGAHVVYRSMLWFSGVGSRLESTTK